jgi:hypothetical protein
VGTYVDIDGDPNDIGARGAALSALGTSFHAKAAAVLSEIQAIEAEQPWAHDEAGNSYWETYNKPPEGGTTPFRETLQDGLARAGDLLSKIGQKTMLAMTEFQGIDQQNSADIKSAKQT